MQSFNRLTWPMIVLIVATVVLMPIPTGFRWLQATLILGTNTVVYFVWRLVTGTTAERSFLLPPLAAGAGAFAGSLIVASVAIPLLRWIVEIGLAAGCS